MSLIHALLLLPRHGEPIAVGRQAAMELRAASPRFVQRREALWSLTRDGQRFLVQFRSERSDTVTRIVVRLVIEDRVPVFHLICDSGRILRVSRANLRRSLRDIQSDNPGVKIVFDFSRSGRVS
jgi:hypothetical protein